MSRAIGQRVEDLLTPVLVADVARVERNIHDMAAAVARAGIALRPHFKTSKSLDVAHRQLEAGAVGFTCATAAEVEALLDHGARDLIWAHNPATPRKAAQAVEFNRRGRVAVGVDDALHVRLLAEAAEKSGVIVPLLVEIDTGMRRTGVTPSGALRLAQSVCRAPHLEFRGVYTHEGQLASVDGNRSEIRSAGRAAGELLAGTADTLRRAGIDVPVVSVGSTPGWDSAPFAPGVTEGRAGTYVFFDANQLRLESATPDQCALVVHTTVVSVQREGGVVIDAGIKAMSSDGSNRGRTFGLVLDDHGLPNPSISFPLAYEEHGILEGPGAANLVVGDRVRILPNHACGAVNMWSSIVAARDDLVEARWDTVGRY